jgi:ADP-heptose:LPS heptosyltransferase
MILLPPLRLLIRISRVRRRFGESRSISRDSIRTLLICELTRMGDVLTTLPVIRLFRDSLSGCAVHIIADERYATTLRAFDRSIVVHGIPDSATAIGILRARDTARAVDADLACSMSPSRRNAWVTLTSRAPAVVGYLGTNSSLTPFLSSYPVEAFGIYLEPGHMFGNEPVQMRPLKIAQALGMTSALPVREVQLERQIVQPVKQNLRSRGDVPTRPYVVIHPFSGWEFRSWPLERFGWLAAEIIARWDRDIVFLCTQSEEKQIAPLRTQLSEHQRVRFVFSKDLLESAVIINEAELFVGNDSGPLHLAASVGTPHVGLFGPAGPELTSPAHPLGHYVFSTIECSPCDQRECIRPHDSCMSRVTTGEVLAAVSSVLMTGHSSHPASYG